jgi:amyloid beta precursor protein binding protein 1
MATADKYDRQLRLWGAKGQRALGETSVLLLRATAAGTESLKNLVLPGIGHFHVLDDVEHVTNGMISSNFFLAPSTNSRAQVACEYLQELNPDCRGTFQHVPSLNQINDWQKQVFDPLKSKHILIIASDLEPPLLEKISQVCHDSKLPLLAVQSYGLLGLVRLQTPPMAMLDPKPTNAPPDLRLVNAFPALKQLAESIDWSALKDHEHSHVPYPLILIKVAQEYKATHGGALPKTIAEKQEFKALIPKFSRGMDKEMNFGEAEQNAYLAYTERTVDCLDELGDDVDPNSKLGYLLAALKQFMAKHQRPPVNGSIPDMTASTDMYVQLQTIYRDQAAKDLQDIQSFLPDTTTASEVSKDDLQSFCTNVYAVGRLQTRTLVEEYNEPPTEELLEDWNMVTFDPYEAPEHTPLIWYLGFRGCQLFYHTHHRYPGVTNDWETDIPVLHECIGKVVGQYQLKENEMIQQVLLSDSEQKVAHELTRYAQAEIHNIASVVGGVASQEAVKIITGQYVPLDNTYVFNGIASVGGVYRF